MSARIDRLRKDVERHRKLADAGVALVEGIADKVAAARWKVGQTVGQTLGHFAPTIHRYTIEAVTISGRARIGRYYYHPNGRPIGSGSPIFAWTDEHEKRWLAQEEKAKRADRRRKRERTIARKQRQADREAIDFGLELIKNRVDGPIVKRLSDLLRSIRPEEESTS